MKELINGLKTFLGLALLITFIFVALQFRPNPSLGTNISGAPLTTMPTVQAYPPPQENVISAQTETTSNPYPMPGESINMAQTSDCTKAGKWIEYVNNQSKFSFQYPAEAEIFESVDNNEYPSVTLFLKPYCYVKEWWGTRQVTVAILLNSDKLSLEEFIVKQYTFDTSTDSLALSRELSSFSTTISVDKTSAIQVNGAITRETPRAYIPYNDFVIFLGLTGTTSMPPFEQPCPTILDLYNKILSSVKFLDN